MVGLNSFKKYVQGIVDQRKMSRGLKLKKGDLVAACEGASGFFFSSGKQYPIIAIRGSYHLEGVCNLIPDYVLFKMVDDNGTLKEVSYSMFRY